MTATDALLALVAVGLVLYRTIRPQPARSQSSARLALILGVIGLYEVVQAAGQVSTHAATTGIAIVAAGLVLAAVLGAVRSATYQFWFGPDGSVWQKGGVATVAVWLVAIGLHVATDVVAGGVHGADEVASASICLYVAVSLGLQRELVRMRAARFAASGPRHEAPVASIG